ncbi:MAG TPA: transcriptional regulator, partial [Dysgonomonas sp.]|nr:transcriptional regulator [Dysgonomonas sp.]
VLNVSPELIRELEEDPLTVIIENNTFQEGSSNVGKVDGDNIINNNPVDRIIELTNEKQALYERMIKVEQEKVALLEEILREKK